MAPVPGDSSKHQFGTSMPQGGHPPHHSITSSARASSDGGTPRPSALAVLRLMSNLYLVGACIGRLASFSPLRLRSSCRLRDGTGCSYRAVALANFQVAHCLAVPQLVGA